MGYHPRIESRDKASFLTSKCRNNELWFVNNEPLESAILALAAKWSGYCGVKLYGLAIEGNHIQAPAHFPNANRSQFMQYFNSGVARAVTRLTPEHPGGSVFGQRFSAEFLPANADLEDKFFYTALQPIQDGLVEKLSEYPWYNCFHDAVNGIERKFVITRWKEYNVAKKRNPSTSIKDYQDEFILKYERIPGYEHLSQKEYSVMMYEKLEKRRLEVVAERKTAGKGFLGREGLLKVPRGAIPRNPKTSTRTSHRARVLSICPERRAIYKAWYFDTYFKYKEASKRYRAGELDVEFPEGTYKPYLRAKLPAG